MKLAVAVLVVCTVLFSPLSGQADVAIDDVRVQISAWRASWQGGDITKYASHYHPAFRSGDLDYHEWVRKKGEVFRKIGSLSVEIWGLSIFMKEGHAIARFVQRYRGGNYSDIGEKTLILEKFNGVWKILSEEWRPQPKGLRLPKQQRNSKPPPSVTANESAVPVQEMAQGIRYEMGPDGSEKIYIRLNHFFIPTILDSGGERPRIVVEILDVSNWSGDSKSVVHGRLIRQIRSSHHRASKKLRIILDLKPSDNYIVNQTYFRDENIYCVSVKP